jgi:hypothetical protein
MKYNLFSLYNGVVAKAQPITTLPNLLNNFLFTSKLTFTITAEQQSKNGKTNFIITQKSKAKTLSP